MKIMALARMCYVRQWICVVGDFFGDLFCRIEVALFHFFPRVIDVWE